MENCFSFVMRKLLVAAATGLIVNQAAFAADFQGFAKVENFDAISGGNIANLTAAAKYINKQPDSVSFVDSLFYSRTPGVDNYGSRISGFLTPTETAEYVFFVAADDSCSFYLSTDSSPANLKLIAADQGWQGARTWTGVGGASSGAGTTSVVFRRGFNPGAAALEANNFEWVGPFQNRSDEFLKSALASLATTNRWPTTNATGNAVIKLTANQSYYFELLFKEGSGGENAGVTWKKAGDPDPANGDPEIPGSFLKVTHPSTISFQTQPQSQTVAQAQTVTFTASALGIPGDSDQSAFTYQWRANGVAITDGTATGQSYTINSASLADNGKKYSVVVTTPGGLTATSAEATLTVTSDTTAPAIKTVRTTDTFNIVRVTFTEPVNNAAATPSNYTLTGGLTVTDANFVIVANDANNPEDPKNPKNPTNRITVVLSTSTQTDGAVYDLTVNATNVKDLVGNALSPNTAKVYANTFKSGLVLHKRWYGLGHRNFQTLLANPAVYDNPTATFVRTLVEENDADLPDQAYMTTLSGFFIPPTTGDYVFFISVDNYGWLYLSTDDKPINQVMTAAEIGWNGARVWTGPGATTTAANPATETAAVYRRGVANPADPYAPWIGPFENRSDQFLTSARAISQNLEGNRPFADIVPWPTTDANGNAKITLTAGKRYSFTLYHSEPEGGQSCATFKLASEADPANATASRMTGNLIGAFIDPSSLPPVITNQPANVDFTLGATINLSVGVDSAAPPTYQWYRGITAISGATNRTLTIPNATLAAVGSYYVTVTTVNGVVPSANALVYTAASAPSARTFQQDSAGLLVVEAENFTGSNRAPDGHVWVAQTDRTGFSGVGYVQPLPDNAVNIGNGLGFITNSPRLDFTVNFTKAGTNYLWFRGGEPRAAGDGDSVHAGINGAPPASAIQISGAPTFTTTGWNWVGNINGDTRAFIVVPNAGPHTVNVWMREDGFYFDKLIVTSEAAFIPTGVGPAESASTGGGGGGSSATISVARNAAGRAMITYTGTLQRATSLSTPITWTDVANAASPYSPPAASGQEYYRARQ
jgi:hypothetical protein